MKKQIFSSLFGIALFSVLVTLGSTSGNEVASTSGNEVASTSGNEVASTSGNEVA